MLEVYKIRNKKNGKIYIGITNQGVATRWHKHCSDAIYGNSDFPIHNAIRKHGKEEFQVEVIEVVEEDDYDQLKEREKYWIKEYNSYDRKYGYNLTLGGDGTFGRFHSEESKEKMRQKALGRKYSEEVKIRRRYTSTCSKVSQFDLEGNLIKTYHSVSDAARQVGKSRSSISKCASGKRPTAYGFKWSFTDSVPTDPTPPPPEPKPKLPKPPMSEEAKEKISIANKLRWAKSPERRKQASLNNYKNRIILQYTLDGEFVEEFRNVSEAVKEIGASTHTNIAKCARGERKSSCGFTWKYKDKIQTD